MLHIGILAHSADGAALCFLEIVRESARRLGPHRHPEITLSIQAMGPTLPLYERNELAALKDYMAHDAKRLAEAQCDFFVCPDNTAHIVFESPGAPMPLPGLHIAEIVAQRAKADGRRCVALLGTKWTMEGPVYAGAFARAGLDMRIPNDAERKMIDDSIFSELTLGVFNDETRAKYLAVIERLKTQGCDAVALSCTEIPILIPPGVSPLPSLDSTRLLAHEAVAAAIEGKIPTWRGGPFANA
jgi:aspartate racemase